MRSERDLAWSSVAAWGASVFLAIVGVVFAASASNPTQTDLVVWYRSPLTKQLLAAMVGLALMYALSRTTFQQLRNLAFPLFAVSAVALCLVWVPGFKAPLEGFHRRIGFGPVTVQPAEFAKLTLVLALGAYCSMRRVDLSRWQYLWPPVAAILFVCILIHKEPDLGSATVVFLIGMTVLYLAGARMRALLSVAVVVGLAVAAHLLLQKDERLDRFLGWWAPESTQTAAGHQVLQSLITISISGLRGVGIGNGEGRVHLYGSNTDYVMACVAEEWGLLGVAAVLVGIGLIVYHAHRVVMGSSDRFARLTAGGIGALFIWQSAINMAVVTNAIPCTGVPMPFISFGTSSLVVMLACVGILMRPLEAVPAPALAEVRGTA